MSTSRIGVWVLAARPKTLFASIAPVVLGAAMAEASGGFHALSACCALLGAVFIQIGTNLANDYFDFVKGTDTAERLGPVRATQAGLVTPRQMKRAAALVFTAAIATGLYLVWRGGWPILLIGVLSVLFGVLYTGGPVPIGYLGLGDIFVLIFFGPVAVAGTYYVQTLHLELAPVVAGFGPGLLSTAILTVNNLRDIEGDRASGKRTLAARFGVIFARVEYVVCVVLACIILPVVLCVSGLAPRWVLLAMLAVVVVLPSLRLVLTQKGAPLNQALAGTGKLTLLHSLLLAAGWLL